MRSQPAGAVIVEDQTIFRELLAEVLESSGRCRVLEQRSEGRDVLETCQRLLPDLLLLDAVLPDITGLEVARRVTAAGLSCRIMLISGHIRPNLVQEALDCGVHGIVSKETALGELRDGVDRVLAGGSFYCSRTSLLLSAAFRNTPETKELTPRQQEILRLIAQGMSSQAIADRLGLSLKTVSNHRLQLRERLGLRNVASLTRYAIEQGWVEPKA